MEMFWHCFSTVPVKLKVKLLLSFVDTMNITHFSSDAIGGAARAANRLHQALISEIGGHSSMIVRSKVVDDWRVTGPEGKFAKATSMFNSLLDAVPTRLQRSPNQTPHSVAWNGAISARAINQLQVDVINLHWVCAGFLSIEVIGHIIKPVVWTLHDMWAFCGSEHLASDAPNARWRLGYNKVNRDPAHNGIDIDRWVWRRKKAAWQRPINIVTPSRWLADCVRSSALMREWDVTVIPNTLDVEKYKPIPKLLAREILRLPMDAKLVLFGAIRGTQSPHKGWDLLQPALAAIASRVPKVHGVIFGQGEPKHPPALSMPLHWLGHLHDDATLALLYSAADVMVVPSRQESFGQTASEAQACGCPVVAFNATGLRDVVVHGQTGYLAEPYSCDDLAKGIEWVLARDERYAHLSSQARERAVRLWSHQVVVPQYLEVYRRVMEAQ